MKKNKNILITGATGGIGVELARKFAEQNNLILVSNSIQKLNKLKDELKKITDKKVNVFQCDFSDTNNFKKLIIEIRKSGLNRIDVLINNAGIFIKKPIKDSDLKNIQDSLNINLIYPFLLIKEFSKEMTENGWGRIVNIGSSSSYDGFENGSIYSSTKHAILGLSRSCNKELKKYGVRVISVSPSSVDTKMGRINDDQVFETFINSKELAEVIDQIIWYNNQMIIDEIRLNRMEIKFK